MCFESIQFKHGLFTLRVCELIREVQAVNRQLPNNNSSCICRLRTLQHYPAYSYLRLPPKLPQTCTQLCPTGFTRVPTWQAQACTQKRREPHFVTMHTFHPRMPARNATPQGTLRSLIGVTARHAYILQQTNKPDRYLTTPKLLTKSNSAT